MPLTFGDKSAQDKLVRGKQEAASLDQAVNAETFLRFACHAWHLCDWITADPTIPIAVKSEVSAWRNNPPIAELYVCKDIINSDKHLEITRYTPSTADASSQQGWGFGRWGKGGWGVGEESISVTMTDERFSMLWTSCEPFYDSGMISFFATASAGNRTHSQEPHQTASKKAASVFGTKTCTEFMTHV